MPSSPSRPCTHSGCPHIQPCPVHKPEPWVHNKPVTRMRGRQLQRARDRLFNAQPLCVECLKRGIERAATQRDHVVPLAEGGTDTDDNTQALCDQCHEIKSQREARRGRHGKA